MAPKLQERRRMRRKRGSSTYREIHVDFFREMLPVCDLFKEKSQSIDYHMVKGSFWRKSPRKRRRHSRRWSTQNNKRAHVIRSLEYLRTPFRFVDSTRKRKDIGTSARHSFIHHQRDSSVVNVRRLFKKEKLPRVDVGGEGGKFTS